MKVSFHNLKLKDLARMLCLSFTIWASFYACGEQSSPKPEHSQTQKFDINKNTSADIARRSPLCVELSKDVESVKDLTVEKKWSFNPLEWRSSEDKERHQSYKSHYATYAKATAIELQLSSAAKMINIPHDEQAIPVMKSWMSAFAPTCAKALDACTAGGCKIGDSSFPVGWGLGMFSDQWKNSAELFDSPSLDSAIKQCGPTKEIRLTKDSLAKMFAKLDKTCSIQTETGDSSYEELIYHEPAVKGVVIDRYFTVGGDKEILKGMCLHEEKIIDRSVAEKRVDATYTLVQTVAQFSISAVLAFLATPEIMKSKNKAAAIPILLADEMILLAAILTPSIIDLQESLIQRSNLKFVSSCHHDALSKRIGRRLSVISTDIIGAAISATIGVGIFSAGSFFADLVEKGALKFIKTSTKSYARVKNPAILKSLMAKLSKTKAATLSKATAKQSDYITIPVPKPDFVLNFAKNTLDRISFLKNSKFDALKNLAKNVGNNYKSLFDNEKSKFLFGDEVAKELAERTAIKNAARKSPAIRADVMGGKPVTDEAIKNSAMKSSLTNKEKWILDNGNIHKKAITAYKVVGRNAIVKIPQGLASSNKLRKDILTGAIGPKEAVDKIFIESNLVGEAVGPSVALAAAAFSRVYGRVKKVTPDYEEVTKSYDEAIEKLDEFDAFRKEIQSEVESRGLIPSL